MVTRVKNTPIGVVYEDGEIVGLKAGKREVPVVTYATSPDGGIGKCVSGADEIKYLDRKSVV